LLEVTRQSASDRGRDSAAATGTKKSLVASAPPQDLAVQTRRAPEALATGNQMPNLSLDMGAAFMIRGEHNASVEASVNGNAREK